MPLGITNSLKPGSAPCSVPNRRRPPVNRSHPNFQRDQASVLAAQRKIAVLVTAKTEAAARAEHARAVQQQAELNLGYTTITAAMDGTVGARTLRVGQYFTADPAHGRRSGRCRLVVANFKETQLVGVHPGQPVKVAVDGQPGLTFTGHIDSISPASGLEFALLRRTTPPATSPRSSSASR